MKKFDLLKEAAARKDPLAQMTVGKFITQLYRELKGKEVKAFPKNFVADNLDTKAKEIRGTQTFKILNVSSTYSDFDTGTKDTFVSLDVALKGYNAHTYDFIYNDATFLRSFKELVKQTSVGSLVKQINYSEYGMQGDNYVNLDVSIRIPKPEGEGIK